MVDALRRRVLALLRVPPEPQPPFGDPASLRVFRAGLNYYRLRMVSWCAAQVLALGALLFWTAILIEVEEQVQARHAAEAGTPAGEGAAAPDEATAPSPTMAEPPAGNAIERIAQRVRSAAENVAPEDPADKPRGIRAWFEGYKLFFVELALLLPGWVFPLVWVIKLASYVVYFVQLPFTYAVRRLDYEMRWYLVTDRSLRLRHGVWNVTESTMSFANIQQVVVSRGPVQRLLGLSDVRVQSAGGGGGAKQSGHHQGGDDMHLGLFRYVAHAEEIRDLILERLRRYRETGLGDPDDRQVSSPEQEERPADETLAAARELLAEAQALRIAAES